MVCNPNLAFLSRERKSNQTVQQKTKKQKEVYIVNMDLYTGLQPLCITYVEIEATVIVHRRKKK